MPSRRRFLRAAGGALALPVTGIGAGRGQAMQPATRAPMEFVDGGDIFCMIGGNSPHGADLASGGMAWPGIWSLTSRHDIHSAFVNAFAGMTFSVLRHTDPPVPVQRLDSLRVALECCDPPVWAGGLPPPTPIHLHSRAVYTVRPPHTVDMETVVTPTAPVGGVMLAWASYMNGPADSDIFIRHAGRWVRAHSPRHGVDATYAPASLSSIQDDLRHFSAEERRTNFVLGYSTQRFDEPVFCGFVRNMVAIFLFDRAAEMRITISPDGGGNSIIPGRANPAWDWWTYRPAMPAGVPRRYRQRLVYKPWTNETDALADALHELARWDDDVRNGIV